MFIRLFVIETMSIKGSNNEPRIPTFIRKLWDMVNDQKISDVISWSSAHDNKAFIICT